MAKAKKASASLTAFPGNRNTWIARAGIHSENAPKDGTPNEKLVFAVLEAIDFSCWKQGDAPEDLTQDQAKDWLVANKTIVRTMNIQPPSYLGLMAGAFNFLAK